MSPRVTVCIVSYNTREALAECLMSLRRVSSEANLSIVVVDNESRDGSEEMIRERFPEVQLIANPYNAGFAKAVNQGFAVADSDYMFILNPDTWVARNALARLLEEIESDSSISAVGAQLTNFAGEKLPSVLAAPTLFKEFWNLIPELKSRLFPRACRLWLQQIRSRETNRAADVLAVSGAAMLVRSNDFRALGGFDERFYLYHEEVDYCIRLRKRGLRVRFVPQAQVLHHDALASGYRTDTLPDEPVLGWRIMGKWLLFAKHGTSAQRRAYVLLVSVLLTVRIQFCKLLAKISPKSLARLHKRADDCRKVIERLRTRECLQRIASRPEVLPD